MLLNDDRFRSILWKKNCTVMRKEIAIVVLSMLAGTCGWSQAEKVFSDLQGPYIGQKTPGKTPEMFAPDVISTGFDERDVAISSDGTEIFYGLSTGRIVTIMYICYRDGHWTEPVTAPFASDSRFFYFEPCFAPDGKTVFFLTTQPVQGKEPRPGWKYQNIFASDRLEDGSWGEPYDPGETINDGPSQFYPSLTHDKTLYFCRTDIVTRRNAAYKANFIDGAFTESSKLPAPVNTDSTSPYNVFVAPDESFLIACIGEINLDYNPGKANYFVFFRNADNSWTEPVPFGPGINIAGSNAMSASVSPDGRFLFFAAQVSTDRSGEHDKPITLSRLIEIANSPRNGNYDIYWVDALVIGEMKAGITGKNGR
jgi:hypothetical protein